MSPFLRVTSNKNGSLAMEKLSIFPMVLYRLAVRFYVLTKPCNDEDTFLSHHDFRLTPNNNLLLLP